MFYCILFVFLLYFIVLYKIWICILYCIVQYSDLYFIVSCFIGFYSILRCFVVNLKSLLSNKDCITSH